MKRANGECRQERQEKQGVGAETAWRQWAE